NQAKATHAKRSKQVTFLCTGCNRSYSLTKIYTATQPTCMIGYCVHLVASLQFPVKRQYHL
uniref:Uncharacterized protein n=1 Tax=Aegilops tauschii subsp. strangulata TaxID=200361 RepID=A0A452Z2U4_AEGTS